MLAKCDPTMKSLLCLCFLASIMSCSREDEPEATSLPFFFIGNINGQTIGFGTSRSDTSAFANSPFEEVQQPRPDSFRVQLGTTVFNVTSAPALSATISIVRVFNHQPDATERAGMIDTGYYRYAFNGGSDKGGASVRFVDGNGVEWSTENHLQADTSFRVELVTASPAADAKALFQARFRCRLFNSLGDSINLENGSVRGKILKP